MMRRVGLWTALAVISLGHVSIAQTATTDDPIIQELIAKDTLGPEDDAILDTWLDDRLNELTIPIEDAQEAAKRNEQFVARFKDLASRPGVTAAFKERLAARSAARFAVALAKVNQVAAETARALVLVLAALNHIATLPGLEAALSFPDPATRVKAATAYEDLIPRIVQDPEQVRAVLAVLRKAGTAEENCIVVGAIYRAMRFPAHVAEAADTMIAVFGARTAKLQAGGSIRCLGEYDAYLFLADQRAQLTDKQRVEIVNHVACFLKADVAAYLGAPPAMNAQERTVIGLRIVAGEDLLQKLVQPPGKAPELRGNLGNAQNLEAEFDKWIGTTETPGLLNEVPWNVALGACPLP